MRIKPKTPRRRLIKNQPKPVLPFDASMIPVTTPQISQVTTIIILPSTARSPQPIMVPLFVIVQVLRIPTVTAVL
ncbi:hypothetical protein [Rhizobium leguminosarum]|uniref:hypothetical protein n=1 Tax=Rhizobium leguminosarum TaxID=384 RepID=UPI001C93F607|nr:hypothetical protein [Rhizobium leguminosarum]MBY5645868.1 hypothetical protein [Rhizobium leguminosarum]